jgi:formamidopyrimidine-DNA glycosylase
MIELPEAATLARQLNESIKGHRIKGILVGFSPHKFAWFYKDPKEYAKRLEGKEIGGAASFGGLMEIKTGDACLLFGDGVNIRLHGADEKRPQKHQLLLELEGGGAISASVQMYGGLWCFPAGEYDNPYYKAAQTKPSPLAKEFDEPYFSGIMGAEEAEKLSAKALLATEQRIPGLGNGVLQDILFNAKIHPRRKVSSFSQAEKKALFNSIKTTLKEMVEKGGRDTEKDLYGAAGGYKTKLSSLTAGKPCQVCGSPIIKQAYMGGSVYFCAGCQKLD